MTNDDDCLNDDDDCPNDDDDCPNINDDDLAAGGGQRLEDDWSAVWRNPPALPLSRPRHPLLPQDCQTKEARYSCVTEAGVLDEPYSAKPAQRNSHTGPPGCIGRTLLQPM
jgi:hypothetical protein